MNEEEINLKKIVQLFLKWKVVVLLIIIIPLVVASFLLFFVIPPVYEGSATLLMPQISNESIILPNEVKYQIESKNFYRKLSERSGVSYNLISRNLKVYNLPYSEKYLKVVFRDTNEENIKKIFDSLIPILEEINKNYYERNVSWLRNRLNILEDRLTEKKKEKEKLIEDIKKKENGLESEHLALLMINLNSIESEISSIEEEIFSISQKIQLSNNFLYYLPPLVSESPVAPKKIPIMVITFAVSVLASILLIPIFEMFTSESEILDKYVDENQK